MPKWIALLRGINVSGHKIIKMEQLRASFAALGFGQVKTHVQSGNVVFEAALDAGAGLTAKIQQQILRDFGFSVPVFLRTAPELEKIIHRNPFLQIPAVDHSKLHVTFLSDDPPKDALEKVRPLAAAEERFHLLGREIYLYCPNGYGTTKLSNTALEKKLAVGATTRNWATVNTLFALAQ